MAKLPSFQFYPGDWMKDPALRACSLAARGLWMDMLCLMFESPRRGRLQHGNGQPVTDQQIARMVGCDPDEFERAIAELEYAGVFSRTRDGVILSRRMERDEAIRQQRAESGSKGGSKNKANEKQNGKQTGKQKAPPSSSTSSSSSEDPHKSPDYSAEFEQFWSAYPSKKAKGAAYKAWRRIKDRPDVDSLVKIIEAHRQTEQWKQGYIPHPATWLNQRRWEDELDTQGPTDSGMTWPSEGATLQEFHEIMGGDDHG